MRKVPRFYLYRIILLSIVLYAILIAPINVFLTIQNTPDYITEVFFSDSTVAVNDSVLKDSITSAMQDTIKHNNGVNVQVLKINTNSDSSSNAPNINEFFKEEFNKKNPKFAKIEKRISVYSIFSVLIIILVNLPFKIYFRKKRKGKPIPKIIYKYTRKFLLSSVSFTTWFLFLSFFAMHLLLALATLKTECAMTFDYKSFLLNFLLISFISKLIIVLFVYHWTKHRLHLHYLEHVFTTEELKKRIFKSKPQHIRKKLWSINTITAISPIVIVIFYISFGITQLGEIKALDITNQGQMQIILGQYSMFSEVLADSLGNNLEFFGYINIVDTLLLIMGITSGLITVLVYLFLFTRWNTESIVMPINELLEKMQLTQKGKLNEYALVRTNDEIGRLTEGYNVMTNRLQAYFDEIHEMNRTLEQKVKQRTAKVVLQKEEIEAQRDQMMLLNKDLELQKEEVQAQKDEIEAQRDEIETQRNTAYKQRDQIELQNKEITDSIAYAKNIQQAVLTHPSTLNPIFAENFILFMPRDIVSGDFYWFTQNNNKRIICVADCTGHGVPGAFMSLLGISYLNEIILDQHQCEPDVIMNLLRKKIITSLHRKQVSKSLPSLQMKDGMDMAMISVDENNRLNFCGANNPLYIVRQKDKEPITKDIAVENDLYCLYEIKEQRMPVGSHQNQDEPFVLQTYQLQKGDTLYMFTDGFADQFGGPKGKKLKYKPFKQLLLDNCNKPMHEQQAILSRFFENWKGSNEQIDDVTVLGVRI